MDSKNTVKNVFKNGRQEPSQASYTLKWIELINLLERNRSVACDKQ